MAATDRPESAPGRSLFRMNAKLTLVAITVVVAVALFVLLTRSPQDDMLISEFQKHKDTYERLSANMQIDTSLSEVASWGFRAFDSLLILHPPTAALSVGRYGEYLRLLKQVESSGISRTAVPRPDVCIYVWGSGWGADTRHVSICSLYSVPVNVVAAGAVAPSGANKIVHIEGRWYLERDN